MTLSSFYATLAASFRGPQHSTRLYFFELEWKQTRTIAFISSSCSLKKSESPQSTASSTWQFRNVSKLQTKLAIKTKLQFHIGMKKKSLSSCNILILFSSSDTLEQLQSQKEIPTKFLISKSKFMRRKFENQEDLFGNKSSVLSSSLQLFG